MSKKSFAERYKAFKKQGDDTKLNKFSKEVIKNLQSTKERAEKDVDKYEELLEEVLESKNEHFMDVDIDKVTNVNNRSQYARNYALELINYEIENEVVRFYDEEKDDEVGLTIEDIRIAITTAKEIIERCEDAIEFFQNLEVEGKDVKGN